MLIYAIVMLIVIFIFALLAIFYYEYANFSEEQEDVLMESEASFTSCVIHKTIRTMRSTRGNPKQENRIERGYR
uniref:Col_cuticle_N domain-containing protein n=1 Tax=Ascaris lumbricoides TaxID=6252 RepID=A0A0M3HJ82_ASCLU